MGKKTNGKVMTDDPWDGGQKVYDNVDVEIIKVSGSRVWGIMSLVKDNYLHYGYFCLQKSEAEENTEDDD